MKMKVKEIGMEKGNIRSAQNSSYHCQKYNLNFDDEGLGCKDPKLYCKFRPSCIIWFVTRKNHKKQ